MTLKKIETVNGLYTFVCESYGNRSGFVHKCELFRNDYHIGDNKVQYYNRTWEAYTYQSVMKGCVSKLLEAQKQTVKDNYKEIHNIKAVRGDKRRKELEEWINNNQAIKAYKELLERL